MADLKWNEGIYNTEQKSKNFSTSHITTLCNAITVSQGQRKKFDASNK